MAYNLSFLPGVSCKLKHLKPLYLQVNKHFKFDNCHKYLSQVFMTLQPSINLMELRIFVYLKNKPGTHVPGLGCYLILAFFVLIDSVTSISTEAIEMQG